MKNANAKNQKTFVAVAVAAVILSLSSVAQAQPSGTAGLFFGLGKAGVQLDSPLFTPPHKEDVAPVFNLATEVQAFSLNGDAGLGFGVVLEGAKPYGINDSIFLFPLIKVGVSNNHISLPGGSHDWLVGDGALGLEILVPSLDESSSVQIRYEAAGDGNSGINFSLNHWF